MRSVSLCAPAVSVVGSGCFPDPVDVGMRFSEDHGELFIDLAGDGAVDQDFPIAPVVTFEPDGAVSGSVTLDLPCLGGPSEHLVEASWPFTQTDTFTEGRVGGMGGSTAWDQ